MQPLYKRYDYTKEAQHSHLRRPTRSTQQYTSPKMHATRNYLPQEDSNMYRKFALYVFKFVEIAGGMLTRPFAFPFKTWTAPLFTYFVDKA